MAVDHLQPEQEYYLQPVEPGRSRKASSVCPVDFSFGGDHLWDRFSVSFAVILFNHFGYSSLSNFQSHQTLLIGFKHFIYLLFNRFLFCSVMGLFMYFVQLFHLEGNLLLIFCLSLLLLLKRHRYVLDYGCISNSLFRLIFWH